MTTMQAVMSKGNGNAWMQVQPSFRYESESFTEEEKATLTTIKNQAQKGYLLANILYATFLHVIGKPEASPFTKAQIRVLITQLPSSDEYKQNILAVLEDEEEMNA